MGRRSPLGHDRVVVKHHRGVEHLSDVVAHVASYRDVDRRLGRATLLCLDDPEGHQSQNRNHQDQSYRVELEHFCTLLVKYPVFKQVVYSFGVC